MKAFHLKALGACCFFLALAQTAIGLLRSDPAFHAFFNHQISSIEVLQDILNGHARDLRPKLLVIGDSVFYGSGMEANHVPDWTRQTIPFSLAQAEPQYDVVDLSMDGLLPLDGYALFREAQRLKPEWVIISLNYRMLADKYQAPAQALSRSWLGEALGSTPWQRPMTFNQKFFRVVRTYFLLYRYAETFYSMVFFPSREERLTQFLRSILPATAWKTIENKELLLKLKLKPYYVAPEISETSMFRQVLLQFLKELQLDHQRAIVVFTPQNQEYIEDIVDPERYQHNLRAIKTLIAPYTRNKEIVYLDLSDQYPSSAFYDHCHLRPEYNRDLARVLGARLHSTPVQGAHSTPRSIAGGRHED